MVWFIVPQYTLCVQPRNNSAAITDLVGEINSTHWQWLILNCWYFPTNINSPPEHIAECEGWSFIDHLSLCCSPSLVWLTLTRKLPGSSSTWGSMEISLRVLPTCQTPRSNNQVSHIAKFLPKTKKELYQVHNYKPIPSIRTSQVLPGKSLKFNKLN